MIKFFKIVTITIILVTCLRIVLHIWFLNSEPYQAALSFIDNNHFIIEKIGILEHRHLTFAGGHSFNYGGIHGNAKFKISVKGKKNGGHVYLLLKKNIGVWNVVQGNLVLSNGSVFSIITN